MNTLKYILLLMTALVTMTALADSQETLTFVYNNGATSSFSTSNLVITYDDFAHAVVTNDETSTTIDLVDVDYMCYGEVEPSFVTGDVNGDSEVNVADVNALIDIILGGTTDEQTEARADVNNDDEVNIADVNALIDIILAS